uniref:Beta/gamma crystallin 'Greek key' domain-containing protein n=1 Tax=Denticeps clupeoides TaxID=299321 RepID=A0AAY4BQS6_9TELE
MASNPVNKIFVYEHPDFQGVSREFTEYCPDLRDVSFNDCISSVKVIGQPWVLYEHPHCQGAMFYFEEGECRSVVWHDAISSLEQVKEDLTNPQITLITLNCETNLCFGSFNDMISSCRVDRGAWVLYEHPNRGGRSILVRAGRKFPSIGWIDNQVSWVRPLKPGRPKITAELIWDKKEENTKSQTFSSELSREYEGSVTESFNFSNATQITVGMSFGFDIGIVKSEVNVSVSNTFTVEKGSSNTKTEKKGVKISIPATIHPHTKLTVNVVRKEVDVKVPVKITIQSGYSSSTEYGEYRCQAGNSILTTTQVDQQ